MQSGGFPPVTDLVVPLGLTVASHWLSPKKTMKSESELGSSFSSTSSSYESEVTSPDMLVGEDSELYGGLAFNYKNASPEQIRDFLDTMKTSLKHRGLYLNNDSASKSAFGDANDSLISEGDVTLTELEFTKRYVSYLTRKVGREEVQRRSQTGYESENQEQDEDKQLTYRNAYPEELDDFLDKMRTSLTRQGLYLHNDGNASERAFNNANDSLTEERDVPLTEFEFTNLYISYLTRELGHEEVQRRISTGHRRDYQYGGVPTNITSNDFNGLTFADESPEVAEFIRNMKQTLRDSELYEDEDEDDEFVFLNTVNYLEDSAAPLDSQLFIDTYTSHLGDLLGNVEVEERISKRDPPTNKGPQRGGNWSQVVGDLAVPVALTATAHLMASRKSPKSSVRRTEMIGGTGLGYAVLKTVDDLIVPLGLMAGSHWLRGDKPKRPVLQEGGGVVDTLVDLSVPIGLTLVAHTLSGKKQRRLVEQTGGSGLPVIGDTYLGKWLNEKGIAFLTPNTLIPLGLAFILYMAYRRYALTNEPEAKLSAKPNIYDMADRKDLKRYARANSIRSLDPDTPVPFALAMGPRVFKQYVDEY